MSAETRQTAVIRIIDAGWAELWERDGAVDAAIAALDAHAADEKWGRDA